MKLIIKGRHRLNVPVELRRYIEEKVSRALKRRPEPLIVDVMLADIRGEKGGIDKVIHITVSLPGRKKPIFISEVATDFFEAVDLTESRLRHQLEKVWSKQSFFRSRSRFKIRERFGRACFGFKAVRASVWKRLKSSK